MTKKKLSVDIRDLGEHFLVELYRNNEKLIFHSVDEILDFIGERIALLSITEEDKDDQEKTECEACDSPDQA